MYEIEINNLLLAPPQKKQINYSCNSGKQQLWVYMGVSIYWLAK